MIREDEISLKNNLKYDQISTPTPQIEIPDLICGDSERPIYRGKEKHPAQIF